MAHVQNRAQSGGTCYAEAAVQVYDAHRHRKFRGLISNTSADYAAFGAKILNPEYDDQFPRQVKDLDGGSAYSVLHTLCFYPEWACSSVYYTTEIKNKNPAAFVDQMRKLHTTYNASEKLMSHKPVEPESGLNRMQGHYEMNYQQAKLIAPQAKVNFQKVPEQLERCLWTNTSPGQQPTSEQVLSTLQSYSHKPLIEFGFQRKFPCPPEWQTSHLKPNESYWLSPRTLQFQWSTSEETKDKIREGFELIHKRLFDPKGGVPTAISVCPDILLGLGGRISPMGLSFDPEKRKLETEKCGGHAALIIGRRRNPKSKKCELLLRNSWAKLKDPRERLHSNIATQAWIEEEKLKKFSYGVDWIEEN